MKKTVLVTGAAGNLGSDVVKTLHAKGFDLCVTTGPSGAPNELTALTKDARQVNLTDEAATQQYVEEITRRFPDLSAAVMLVGGFAMGGIQQADEDSLDKQISLNFKTAYFITKPLMAFFEQKGGGQFIFIGARPALVPEAGKDLVAYALAKSLVFRLAEIVNAAGKGKRITATVLVPSTIDTQSNRRAMPDADFSKWVKGIDIAEIIAFTLSDPAMALRETVLKVYNES